MTTATLLLIHGLGGTPGVWAGLIERLDWRGPVRIATLPGHGAAPWTGDYTLGSLAAAVSEDCDDGERCVIVGHSLGGAVGIELASGRYRPDVAAVVAVGVKTTWTDDDVTGMAKVASRGVRWFERRDEAIERFLRQAGLAEVTDSSDPAVADAVVEGTDPDGRPAWRVAQDPATFAQQPVAMADLLAAAMCPVVLGAGEHDAMATPRGARPVRR